MKNTKFEKLAAEHGTWEHDGKTLTLLQQPHITGQNDNAYYEATAIDKNYERQETAGEIPDTYLIRWEIINFETTDESDACDWDNPVSITKK
jgi:hypothetical protein